MRTAFSLFLFLILSCSNDQVTIALSPPLKETRSISFNNVSVDVIIDKPEGNSLDVIVAYHGTVFLDSKILSAANITLDAVKKITNRKDMMFVSVAYPEEGLLMGDNVKQSEAALLWVKNKASQELGITVKKIFLVGHSQGGYIVTRLNRLHETDGVVANGPGPLDLILRCQLEESDKTPASVTCDMLRSAYGSTSANSNAYRERSLLFFADGFKSDILFVQGLLDAQIQLTSWPTFKQKVTQCTNCKDRQFLDVANYEHTALFDSPEAKVKYNGFLNR
ncbi:MAG: alpha/beta hydrolase fold domain-containing protein [Cyclobacteriaceae bacterium]|jgi:hypothetical protein|nr:alpha/beta hydrolase [Flammeovirgaceae bacterium]